LNTILLSEPIEESAIKLLEGKAQVVVSPDPSDANGREFWNELDDRPIGLNLDELRKINHKIGFGVGREKVEGILGALKGKFLNVLITDEDTAASLLERSTREKD
jgi:DNA-binding transcriptional regulator LsrR (DeoR family)